MPSEKPEERARPWDGRRAQWLELTALLSEASRRPLKLASQSKQMIRATDVVHRCGCLGALHWGDARMSAQLRRLIGLEFPKRATTIRQQRDTSCHADYNLDYG